MVKDSAEISESTKLKNEILVLQYNMQNIEIFLENKIELLLNHNHLTTKKLRAVISTLKSSKAILDEKFKGQVSKSIEFDMFNFLAKVPKTNTAT